MHNRVPSNSPLTRDLECAVACAGLNVQRSRHFADERIHAPPTMPNAAKAAKLVKSSGGHQMQSPRIALASHQLDRKRDPHALENAAPLEHEPARLFRCDAIGQATPI
jgi:hypothetical protein